MTNVICPSKLSVLFKDVEIAYVRASLQNFLPTVHLLDIIPIILVGMSFIDDTIPFLMACYLGLAFLIIAFSIFEIPNK